MFTGIITHLGTFVKQTNEGYVFKLPADLAKQTREGLSIAINGVCLTVKKQSGNTIHVNVMAETLKKTTLASLKAGTLVNLELPATPATFLAGHLVQGHVDGIAKLAGVTKEGNSRILKFLIPPDLAKYIVSKGSITLNGISLTIIEAGEDFFTVGIVPYSWNHTMLRILKTGDLVNMEVDILAKILERLIKK